MSKVIKICGLKSTEVIEASKIADYLGFVAGSPKSPRNLQLKDLAKLIDHVNEQKTVVVTVNKDPTFLRKLVDLTPDVIQLHGEARKFATNVDCSVGLAYSKAEYLTLAKRDFIDIQAKNVEYLTVDSLGQNTNHYGGTGEVWKWELLPPSHYKILIAGGISVKNFKKALDDTDADGIDISSSVEVNGQKNPHQIIQIIKKFKEEYT